MDQTDTGQEVIDETRVSIFKGSNRLYAHTRLHPQLKAGSNLELIAAVRGGLIAGRHRNRDRDSCSDRASQNEFSTRQPAARKRTLFTRAAQTAGLQRFYRRREAGQGWRGGAEPLTGGTIDRTFGLILLRALRTTSALGPCLNLRCDLRGTNDHERCQGTADIAWETGAQ